MAGENVPIFVDQGGRKLTVSAGAQLNCATSTLAENGIATGRLVKVVPVALAAVDTAGGVFAWANPEASAILARVLLDVTTQSSGACTVDVGVAANGTTLNDTLLDGLSVAATGVFDSHNDTDNGINGKGVRKVSTGQFITASVASGASAGLVGVAYIHYWAI